MELFHETKSLYHDITIDVIHKLYQAKKLQRKEILEYLHTKHTYKHPNFPKSLLNENDGAYNFHILKNSETHMSLSIDKPFPIRSLDLEKLWLKNMLRDPKIHLFLKDVTYLKLQHVLHGLEDIIENNIEVKNGSNHGATAYEALKEPMELLITAMVKEKGILYDYLTHRGNVLHGLKSIPYKLEYSIREGDFYVVAYSLDGQKSVRALLKSFKNIISFDLQHGEKSLLSSMEKELSHSKVHIPIVLEIIDSKNAVERAFLLFSCFEKKSKYIASSHIHELSIYYYPHEKEAVLSKILSLGKTVKVKSPQVIRHEMIEKIKLALHGYGPEE